MNAQRRTGKGPGKGPSVDDTIAALIDRKLAELGAPSIEWAPAEACGYDRRQAKRDAAKFGLRVACIGKRTFVHVPMLHAFLESNAIKLAAADDDEDVEAAFGVTRAGGGRR